MGGRIDRPSTRRFWAGTALSLAVAAGCTGPAPLRPVGPSGVVVVNEVVEWTSGTPTLGIVRYGRTPGAHDVVAYPYAADREDRSATTAHRVPLLSAAAGDTLYLVAIDVSEDGRMTAGAEMRTVVGTSPQPACLRWTMIDVGFGDSHLLTMPATGRRVLVDAGERRDAANVLSYLADAGVQRLDAVIATHVHVDHIGGLVGEPGTTLDGVLGAFEVGAFLEGPNHSGQRAAYDELLATVAARGLSRATIETGDTDADNPALDWDPGVHVEVLNAGYGRSIGGDTESDWINNDSVVLRIRFGQVEWILGGDAEAPVQARLLASGPPLDSEILKVHHHGVADASEPAYLNAVRPRVGLIPISTDESFSGTLPSGTVLQRLRDRRIDVYASDRAEALGVSVRPGFGYNVTVVTDGLSYEVQVEPSSSRHWAPEDFAAATRRIAP